MFDRILMWFYLLVGFVFVPVVAGIRLGWWAGAIALAVVVGVFHALLKPPSDA